MKKEITTGFNVLATLVLAAITVLFEPLLAPVENPQTIIEVLTTSYPALAIIFYMLAVGCILAVAKLFQELWNRLISDVFKLREINYREAYAFSILFAWIFLG